MIRVAAAVLPALFVLSSCDTGDDIGEDIAGPAPAEPSLVRATDQPEVGDGLLFARFTGEIFEINEGVVECFPSEEDAAVDVVRLTAPRSVQDLRRKGNRLKETFLYVETVPGTTGWFEMPLTQREFDKGPSDVTVFGVDAENQDSVSSFGEESTGSITILEATCDPAPRMAFTIRATLDSELGDLPPLAVVGGLAAGEAS